MRCNYIVFLVAIVFFSCTKNSQTNSQLVAGKFISGNNISIKPPVMYVQDKQITDSAIINLYTRSHNIYKYYTYATAQNIVDTFLQLEFGAHDTVFYKHNKSTKSFKGVIKKYSNSLFLLQDIDSAKLAIDSYPENLNRCDTLFGIGVQFRPEFRYTIHSIDIYGSIGYKSYASAFPILEENGQLILPILTYSFSTKYNYPNSSGNCSNTAIDVFQLKAAAIENNLFANDTIVVQEKRIIFKKAE
jgi:hypothetical protein